MTDWTMRAPEIVEWRETTESTAGFHFAKGELSASPCSVSALSRALASSSRLATWSLSASLSE